MESSSSSWDHLPLNLQEHILLLLPISTLIRCLAASRSLRSLIRSPTFISSYTKINILFLFSDPTSPLADAYDPLLDRWFSLPLLTPAYYLFSSDGPLILLQSYSFMAFNPFTRRPLHLPCLPHPSFFPLALISHSPRRFTFVAVSSDHRLSSHVYQSWTSTWHFSPGFIEGRFNFVGNAVFLQGQDSGLLYCLTRGPDRLLAFDPAVSGGWGFVNVDVPPLVCSHLLVFDGGLFLIGGVEELGVTAAVGIWKLDWGTREFRVWCFMPDDVFAEFSSGKLDNFQAVDRKGKICLCSRKRDSGALVLMCDLGGKKWWWPRSCKERKTNGEFMLAVEPYVDLLKENNGLLQ